MWPTQQCNFPENPKFPRKSEISGCSGMFSSYCSWHGVEGMEWRDKMVLKTPYLASVEMRLPTKFNQISNELTITYGKFKLKKVVNSSESIGATFSAVVLQHNALMFLWRQFQVERNSSNQQRKIERNLFPISQNPMNLCQCRGLLMSSSEIQFVISEYHLWC